MTDLSTYAGQVEHYRGVRNRLLGRREPIMRASPEPAQEKPRALFLGPIKDAEPVDLLCHPSWRVIAGLVALKYGVTVEELIAPARTRHLTVPRQEAIYLVATHISDISLPRIGRHFNRDHTTALYAIRKIAEERGEDTFRQIGEPARSLVEKLRVRMNQRERKSA